ncbi:M12 family metallopeptidase [Pedobacter sp. NJ-S-72]
MDDNLSATKQDWVSGAIKHWEDNTNLYFVKRKKEKNYVRFRSGDGCSSNVSMSGGRQYVTLGNCSLGKTIHEIGHAIGPCHEQTRTDRDQSIRYY